MRFHPTRPRQAAGKVFSTSVGCDTSPGASAAFTVSFFGEMGWTPRAVLGGGGWGAGGAARPPTSQPSLPSLCAGPLRPVSECACRIFQIRKGSRAGLEAVTHGSCCVPTSGTFFSSFSLTAKAVCSLWRWSCGLCLGFPLELCCCLRGWYLKEGLGLGGNAWVGGSWVCLQRSTQEGRAPPGPHGGRWQWW